MSENNSDWRELRQLVERTGLTQDKLAVELGVSLRTVCGLGSPKRKHGVNKLVRERLEQLARA